MLIGDKDFLDFWDRTRGNLTQWSVRVLLAWLMKLAGMPLELTGTRAESRGLLSRFSPDLSPDHSFWQELAGLVGLTYPEGSLAEANLLARQLHQFRYVISSQQAQWVRQNYRRQGMTDDQALAKFLKTKRRRRGLHRVEDFTLSESARLHNKQAQTEHGLRYPDGKPLVNIKVLLGFHSEFILDEEGRFLNLLDIELTSQNAIVNTASFNYASSNNQCHRDLDISPVGPHDPSCRRQVLTKNGQSFLAPSLAKTRQLAANQQDWQRSYFNDSGDYANNGRSKYQAVQAVSQTFAELIKKS